MILYHGSYLEIEKPDLRHSRSNVDFGRGFYVTPMYDQAAKWCGKFKRRGKDGIISRYAYAQSQKVQLKILKFDSYCEDWLDFILNCRNWWHYHKWHVVIAQLYWSQLVLVQQSPAIRLRNALLFTIQNFWRVMGVGLLQVFYWGIYILFASWTLLILPIVGIWYILFLSQCLLYDRLNNAFHTESLLKVDTSLRVTTFIRDS